MSNIKRITIAFWLLISVLMFALGVRLFSEKNIMYNECIYSVEDYLKITGARTESESPLTGGLRFNGQLLSEDRSSGMLLYTIYEGDESAFNPEITFADEFLSGKYKIAITNIEGDAGISADTIADNTFNYLLVYSEREYTEYILRFTTLPIMSISYAGDPASEDVDIRMSLYDNRKDADIRVVESDGQMHVRGLTSSYFPKQGYRLRLSEGKKKNHVSLLGLREDEDWILYAGYNDQEKIRNVFSCNLWKQSCAKDYSEAVDFGTEYRYLELFLNGEYWGLYALCYPIDEKQVSISADKAEEVLYKKKDWHDELKTGFGREGWMNGYSIMTSKANDRRVDTDADFMVQLWQPLHDYYNVVYDENASEEELLSVIDLTNSMDNYLFINLVQGTDNVSQMQSEKTGSIDPNDSIKNFFLLSKKTDHGNIILYAPWDLDYSWGNAWGDQQTVEDCTNFTLPYYWEPEEMNFMVSGAFARLLRMDPEGYGEKLSERYEELRNTFWSDERIGAMLDDLESKIYDSGAYMRDNEKWSGGGYQSVSLKLSVFREYVSKRFEALDMFYLN